MEFDAEILKVFYPYFELFFEVVVLSVKNKKIFFHTSFLFISKSQNWEIE